MALRTVIFSLLVAGLACATGFPQGTSSRPIQRGRPAPGSPRPAYMQQLSSLEETQQVTRAVLKNGMTVLVHEFRTLPVAALLIYVRSGYLNEPDDVAGVSQILQRLLFKATVTKDAGTIDKQIRALGGILEMDSGPEQTSYTTVVPSAQWKKAAEIQADAFLNSALEEKHLQTEVEAILWEARRAREDPDYLVREKLFELAFSKHRLRRSSYGTDEGLRNLNRTKLLEHYKATHRPERVIMVVAGDVNTSEVLTEAVRLYGKAKSTPEKNDRPPAEVEQSGFRYRQLRGPVQAPMVAFGFHTAPVASDDYPALQILRALLGKGRGAILSRRLRDQNKLILRGETELLAQFDAGFLITTMEVELDKIDKAQLAFMTELEILKRQPPEARDLERALAQLEREFWLTGETVQERAASLAYFEAIGGWKSRNSYIARLRKVKPAELSAAAGRYLKLENCSMFEYLPVGAEARNLTTEGVQRTFADLVQVSTTEELAKREKATVQALHVPEGADSFNYSEVRFPMQKASILRGPELFIREDHTLPLIEMGIFFPGGKLFEKKENSGITALMLQTMLHGSKDIPADQFYQQLEIYGAEIVPVVADDYFGFRFTVLSKNIERGMDALLQVIKSPRFDASEAGQEQKRQLASLGRQRDASMAYALRLLAQGLFGEFPYALNALGTEASVASLNLESLKAWYKTTIENREPTVIIIGDTEGTNLARYFVRNFSGSRIQQTKIPEEFPKPVEKKIVLEENRDRSASAVAFGFQAPPEGDPDSATLAVLEKYATGPGGRLMDELREKRALVHEVSFAYRPRLRGGSVVIYLTTAPEKTEAAQKALEEEIRRFAETPVLYKEYRTAINQAVAAYWINQQSRRRQIVTTMQHFLGGRELAVMNEYPARLQAVREEDLQDIAQRILKLERSVTVRLHGKSDR